MQMQSNLFAHRVLSVPPVRIGIYKFSVQKLEVVRRTARSKYDPRNFGKVFADLQTHNKNLRAAICSPFVRRSFTM